ncbi:MAG: glycosyltransferase family 2 protein [Candidatus Melainabacteria bacterium]
MTQDGAKRNQKVVVVMPAYHAEKTLAQTVADIPRDWVDDILVVDDASTDRTVAVAESLGLPVIRHAENKGYGGNQKTCYAEALARGADVVVMVHPDHQYDPRLIPHLVAPLLSREADAVFGSRMLGGRFFEGGMPYWKFVGNVVLTAMGNLMLSMYLTEFHSGFRAYSRRALETIPFEDNSDNFVFDTQMIIQCRRHGLSIHEVPISTRYFDEASQINFADSCLYAWQILENLILYRLFRLGWCRPRFLVSSGRKAVP